MVKTKKKNALDHRGHSPHAQEIIAALADLHQTLKSGAPLDSKYPVSIREVEVPEPRKYSARSIRSLRQKLGVSQPVFAKLVGVSRIQQQSWEQGKRLPNPMARRIFDEISENPQHWAAKLQPQS